jgi:hypothetical protein
MLRADPAKAKKPRQKNSREKPADREADAGRQAWEKKLRLSGEFMSVPYILSGQGSARAEDGAGTRKQRALRRLRHQPEGREAQSFTRESIKPCRWENSGGKAKKRPAKTGFRRAP